MMRTLYMKCGSEQKRILEFIGGAHNDTWIMDGYSKLQSVVHIDIKTEKILRSCIEELLKMFAVYCKHLSEMFNKKTKKKTLLHFGL